jgi:hypothetical protein
VIFSDDHDPSHVHAYHGKETCKTALHAVEGKFAEALQLAAENRLLLQREWERIHG